jgi:hypothetical protein
MDKKSWIKDIVSPTNLWGMFSFAFPGASSIVTGILLHLAKMPPGFIALAMLMAAACAIIIVDYLKRNSLRQKLGVSSFKTVHFYRVGDDHPNSLFQLAARVENHAVDQLYFDFDVISLVIQGRANTEAKKVGPPTLVRAGGSAPIILPMINDLKDGEASGIIHLRFMYGKTIDRLKIDEEWKFTIKGQIYVNAEMQPRFSYNVMLEDFKSR